MIEAGVRKLTNESGWIPKARVKTRYTIYPTYLI